MNQKVAVLGAGRMGSALATALFKKGFATAVWNRTAAKAAPLAKLGLRVAPSVPEAVQDAGVVVVNINNYDATKELLRHPDVQSALRGKMLVQLTTGTPDEARDMESWAGRHGIEYLDGAILGSPADIAKSQGNVFYSGSEERFNRIKPVLLAFGDNAIFVGNEIGHASALDVAVLSWGMGAMFGFLQGYIVCETERFPIEKYLEFVKNLMPVLDITFAGFHRTIQEKDYDNTQASLEAYAACPKELIQWSKDHGIDHSLADAQLALCEKAIKAGKSQADFSYLYEVLKKGSA